MLGKPRQRTTPERPTAPEAALARARLELPGENPTVAEKERLLREVHVYAREGEIVYIFGNDEDLPKQ